MHSRTTRNRLACNKQASSSRSSCSTSTRREAPAHAVYSLRPISKEALHCSTHRLAAPLIPAVLHISLVNTADVLLEDAEGSCCSKQLRLACCTQSSVVPCNSKRNSSSTRSSDGNVYNTAKRNDGQHKTQSRLLHWRLLQQLLEQPPNRQEGEQQLRRQQAGSTTAVAAAVSAAAASQKPAISAKERFGDTSRKAKQEDFESFLL